MNLQTCVRFALCLLAAGGGLALAYAAYRDATSTLRAIAQSQRLPATVVSTAQSPRIEVELDNSDRPTRVLLDSRHDLWISPFQRVHVYWNTAKPEQSRIDGPLQLWLIPTVLVIVASLLFAVALLPGYAERFSDQDSPGWRLLATPVHRHAGDLRLHHPSSHVRANLFWMLLGVIAFGIAFAPGATFFQRMGLMLAGGAWTFIMLLFAAHHATYTLSANDTGLLESSALGCREVRWTDIAAIENRTTRTLKWSNTLRHYQADVFTPDVKKIVLMNSAGRDLMKIDAGLVPSAALYNLLDVCRQRTKVTPRSAVREVFGL